MPDADAAAASSSSGGAAKGVPKWLQMDMRMRWWSESQQKFMAVRVTSIDAAKKVVIVTFELDKKVWKSVPFSQLGGRGCPLQRLPEDPGKSAAAAPAEAEDDGDKTPDWWTMEKKKMVDKAEQKKRVEKAEEARKKAEEEEKRLDEERKKVQFIQAEKRKVEEAFEKRKKEAEAQKLKEEEEWREKLRKRREKEAAEEEEREKEREEREERKRKRKEKEKEKEKKDKKKKKEEEESAKKAGEVALQQMQQLELAKRQQLAQQSHLQQAALAMGVQGTALAGVMLPPPPAVIAGAMAANAAVAAGAAHAAHAIANPAAAVGVLAAHAHAQDLHAIARQEAAMREAASARAGLPQGVPAAFAQTQHPQVAAPAPPAPAPPAPPAHAPPAPPALAPPAPPAHPPPGANGMPATKDAWDQKSDGKAGKGHAKGREDSKGWGKAGQEKAWGKASKGMGKVHAAKGWSDGWGAGWSNADAWSGASDWDWGTTPKAAGPGPEGYGKDYGSHHAGWAGDKTGGKAASGHAAAPSSIYHTAYAGTTSRQPATTYQQAATVNVVRGAYSSSNRDWDD